jgi:glycosyltransferase involved in cell wall biosynthesis
MVLKRPVKLSAAIICFNEEANIRRCLESVSFCDEIVVVDNGSTDRTLSICRELAASIIYHEWEGHVKQKQFALSQCQGEWILSVDSDEQVSDELKNSILAGITSPGKNKGFAVNRVVYFLGRFWRSGGWYREHRTRVFRKDSVATAGEDPHDKFLVDGPVASLKGDLYHFTYKSLKDQIHSLNKLSSIAAESLYENGKRFSFMYILVNPIIRFIRFYVLKRGFLEGKAGFIVAVNEAVHTFWKYAKLWEAEKNAPRPK